MSLALLIPTVRAAVRERLQGVVDLDATVSVMASGGTFTRSAGSWIEDGFAFGQEVTVSGLSGGNGRVRVTGVSPLVLQTSGSGTGSGAGRFLVALPAKRVYEGELYAPQADPFVAEVLTPVSISRQGAGPSGAIEHRLLASFTLFYPREQGLPLAIERMAGAVMAHFRPGTSLSRADIGAKVLQVDRSPLNLDGEWMSCAVSATLIAFAYA